MLGSAPNRLNLEPIMEDSGALLAVPHPWIKQTTASRAIVLLYHRVADLKLDPQLLAVTPKHFEEHLQALTESYEIVTISRLIEHLRDQTLPKRTVAITFDDGYKDNLEAKSLLEKYGVPATVYVTAGALDNRHEFWWDELEQLFLEPGDLPKQFRCKSIDFGKLTDCSQLGEAAKYGANAAEVHKDWSVARDNNPTARHLIYREVHNYLRFEITGHREREAILQDLFDWAGRNRQIRSSHQALSEVDVTELASNGLVEIGSHTTNHPVLSTLSRPDQLSEIIDSRRALEKLLGQPIHTFAYPYGSRQDFTSESVELVRESGYTSACSNIPDVAWKGADRFQLPRVLVRNCSGVTLSNWLEGWF
jgi:peptidoglycan/xylan/chitin deacetylase (PgdA/CDA1 family)